MTWTYLDGKRQVAIRTHADGSQESRLASAVPADERIQDAPAVSKAEAKASVLAACNAVGFTVDQLRVIRALALLAAGNAAQKTKALALLQPLVQVVADVKAAAAAIDAGQAPADITIPTLGTDDP